MYVTAYAVIEPSTNDELRELLNQKKSDREEARLTIRSIDPPIDEKNIGFVANTWAFDGFTDLFSGPAYEGNLGDNLRIYAATVFIPTVDKAATITITPQEDA